MYEGASKQRDHRTMVDLVSQCAEEQRKGPRMHPALAEDLRNSIFMFLDGSSLARAGTVCREWKSASHFPQLWKALCVKRWQGRRVGELQHSIDHNAYCELGLMLEVREMNSILSFSL